VGENGTGSEILSRNGKGGGTKARNGPDLQAKGGADLEKYLARGGRCGVKKTEKS